MRNPSSLVGLALIVVLGFGVGCGSSGRRGFFGDDQSPTDPTPGKGLDGAKGFGGDAGKELLLDPESATVIIDTAATPVTPGTVAFKVSKLGQDLTGGAQFSLKDGSLGTFSGATFTSVAALPVGVLGKSTSVHAVTTEGEAVGALTVVALRKTGPQRDFFFIVPYKEAPSPKSDVLKFSTNIKQADVAFSMDTTGSMGNSITNLKSSLQGSLFAQLQAAIPNVGLAVVDFKDFGDGAAVVKVRQAVTTNLGLAQSAVGAMSAGGGGDEPEASIASMQFALLGQANAPIAAHPATVPGTFGGVDFRTGSVPVVVNITDATWHDPSGNATMASLKAAFIASKAKFVAVTESSFNTPETQANDLSDATGSSVPPSAFGSTCTAGQCCTGVNGAPRPPAPSGMCRLNFVSQAGAGVGSSIVKAISAIAVGSSFDVKAVASNDPANANGVDATKFIKSLRAMEEGNPAEGCPAATAKDSDGDGIKDTFLAVAAGTPVCFEVIPAMNDTVPATLDPQFFNAFIDVVGLPANLKLDTRSVLFLVPPTVNGVR